MDKKIKKVTILIPCFNEEKGIGKVIDSIPLDKLSQQGYRTEIIVINNNSTDRTAYIAVEKGVILIDAIKKGKGNALKAGFDAISDDTSFVIMLDGDNTYKGSEVIRLLEPLESNFADVVVGSRLGGRLKKNSLALQNRFANWGYTFLVRHFYHANVTDVLSGYFAWKKPVIDKLLPYIESDGFSVEMEMIIKMTRLGYYICSVPITYDEREGETKIEALADGLRILHMFFKNFFWYRKVKAETKVKENKSKSFISTKVQF